MAPTPNTRNVQPDDLCRLRWPGAVALDPEGRRAVVTLRIVDRDKNKYRQHLWILPLSAGGTGVPPLSSAPRQFTFGEVSDAAPRFSPDGSRIAFLRTREAPKSASPEAETQIYIIPADGGEARQVTHLPEGHVGAPRWSPDGRRLLFSYRPTDLQWTKKAKEEREKSGAATPPRVVTRLRYRLDAFGYFGDSREHIWLCDAETGEARQITDGHFDDFSPAWSPDGARIAFLSNRGDEEERPYEVDVWLVSLEGDGPHPATAPLQKVETLPGYKHGLCFSPDGNWLAYYGEETEEDPWVPRNNEVWVVPVPGGTAGSSSSAVAEPTGGVPGPGTAVRRTVVRSVAPSGAAGAGPSGTPRHPKDQVRSLTGVLDRNAGNSTLSDQRAAFAEAEPPVWTETSDALYFELSDRGSTHLYRARLDADKPERLTKPGGDLCAFDVRAGRLAVVQASPTRPAWVAFGATTPLEAPPSGRSPSVKGNLHPPDLQEAWDPNQTWRAEVLLAEPEEFHVERAGATLQAWLLHPPAFDPAKKYPLVLYIHGGPHAQYGNTFFHEFQFLAARGYVVLYSNPRGSMGGPEAFAAAIRGAWGIEDYADLMAIVDHACCRPYVDTTRLAVAGGSYGGYMTCWIVGHTDRFRCAITDRCVSDLVAMAGTCDYVFTPDGYWKGNWWSDPEAMWNASPLKYIGNCKTPLLIIHSEGDLRCPIAQAEAVYSALKRLKREVVFVRYPQETSHGMSRGGPPDLRLDRLQRIAAWLDKWLAD